jgi:hypothetical protein
MNIHFFSLCPLLRALATVSQFTILMLLISVKQNVPLEAPGGIFDTTANSGNLTPTNTITIAFHSLNFYT